MQTAASNRLKRFFSLVYINNIHLISVNNTLIGKFFLYLPKMDSGDYSPPPSFSSGGMRSMEPEFPAYYQPTVAVDQNTTQAPSISSTGIRNSEPQFPTDGQRTVPGESHVQPSSYSDLQHGPRDSITGGSGDRGLGQTDYGGQAPSLGALVHENNSAPGLNGYNDYEQPPSYSGVAPRDPSNPGVSTDHSPTYDPGFSIVGRNFPRGSLM
ncbi:hypothetical protein L1987_43603 [Smallanthus sonchifolius]|uniref:Uncharacterized protein n=1 Tax=Smallanthus sonchifolius TaxID=185202 RepID=A0ACB9GM26_9ASTR|nr:hypothetical protein L1987_43603 [Smallanthus sonchifolius]